MSRAHGRAEADASHAHGRARPEAGGHAHGRARPDAGPTTSDGRAARRHGATAKDGISKDGTTAGGRAAARVSRKRNGKKKVRKIIAFVAAGLVLATTGLAYYVYQHLNGNIRSDALFNGANGSAGKEKADAFGRTPINVLLIGSDERGKPQDCKIGGACDQPGARADVEMVLHVSADRSNITVMSIPRDLMTNLPACTNPATHTSSQAHWGQINSALNYGPGCSVAAVHELTGIPIDHFMKVDFAGVIAMSDAVGGVNVCVDNNVYDPQSHLKLKKGQHTLQGVAALEFLRTRHGFKDGSDLGRSSSQHLFMTQVINKFKDAGTLSDPKAMWDLANAATKALTVDPGLDSISKLTGLALDVNKVSTTRITFTTMQVYDDPNPGEKGRVLMLPQAHTLFHTIVNDQSLTTGSGKKAPTSSSPAKATAAATAPTDTIAVSVLNGSGITGRAGAVAQSLVSKGFSSRTTSGNASAPAATTTLSYGSGRQAEARTVATTLGLPGSAIKKSAGSGIVLVIGSDWSSGTVFSNAHASPAPADTKRALSNASVQHGNDTTSCAHVNTYDTAVTLNGRAMTPTRAYALSPAVKDSDGK